MLSARLWAPIGVLSFGLATMANADEGSATLDDPFMRQGAAQVALAVEAAKCELRTPSWRDKLIEAVRERLILHLKSVRPTWSSAEDDAIAGQIVYGATASAEGETGAPEVDATDLMRSGEQMLAKSMSCQVTAYRKTELLFLDGIVDGANS